MEHLRGDLPSLASGPGGTFVLDQAAAPRPRSQNNERPWSGVSGAAIFCEEVLVGVVVRDDAEFDNRRLHAAPVYAFATAPDFAALFEHHVGTAPVLEQVGEEAAEQFRQWESLLRRLPQAINVAGSGEMLLGRDRVQTGLVGVVRQAGKGQVVVVRGEPGVGKSSLALRVVDDLRAQSAAVLVAPLTAMRTHAGALARLIGKAVAVSADSADVRQKVLVLDGVEGVLEGFEDLCAEAVEAALAAEITPVLVGRDDAADGLGGLVQRFSSAGVVDFRVPPLDDAEIQTVLAAAPELTRLARDPRSRWLLRRLAVVDLLLRSIDHGGDLPAVLTSEADVYIHVWDALVQRQKAEGVGPDDRTRVMVSLAGEQLSGRRNSALSGAALASLRSDGLLAPLGGASAVSGREHDFAHDVLRDFAIARRLLLDDGPQLLELHGARCALRAARIVCQVRLRPKSPDTFVAWWSTTYAQFQELAKAHGSRWEEVPWEAVLSASWCGEALEALTGRLLREPALLTALLRCVALRFAQGGVSDALVTAPVVAWLVRQRTPFLAPGEGEADDELVLGWLRAVSEDEAVKADITGYRPVRVLLRERLLQAAPKYPSEGFLEALALLGSDRDEAASTLLRDVAQRRPHVMMHAVDRVHAARCLAATDAALLGELALAYYRPRSLRPGHAASRRRRDGGRHEYWGIRERGQAAWYRGPFYALLSADLQQGTALIKALLDAELVAGAADGEKAQDAGLRIAYPGMGVQQYPGGDHAWAWYRGVLSGPQPCMSALMALERRWEELIQADCVSAPQAARAVLVNVGTSAGAGLAYGLLVRHLEEVTDELDGFLSSPAVWELEYSRVANNRVFGKQADLHDNDRLDRFPEEVAMRLVVLAKRRNDEPALTRLKEVGKRLRAAAPESPDPLAVANWADHLDWERFALVSEGDQTAIVVRPSDDVAQELAKRRTESALSRKRYELINRYALFQRPPHRAMAPKGFDSDQLLLDLAAARSLASSDVEVWDAVCAVAAAAIHAVVQGAQLPADDLAWSVDLLTSVTEEERTQLDAATLPWGAQRMVALALPHLLVDVGAGTDSPLRDGRRRERVRAAIIACAEAAAHEIRASTVEGLRPVWSAACADGEPWCHHAVAWDAIQAGVQLVLEEANAFLRGHGSSRPPVTSLDQLTGDEGAMATLGTVLPAVLEAARTQHCTTAQARTLRTSLLNAYTRTACAWEDLDYHRTAEQHCSLAAALLRTADAEPEVLNALGEALASSAYALSPLLYGLKLTATYEPELIKSLGTVWPHLMETALTQPVQQHRAFPDETCEDEELIKDWERRDSSFQQFAQERLLEELIPQPILSLGDPDPDATLHRARDQWLSLAPLEDLIDAWTTWAEPGQFAADHLIDLLKTQLIPEQLEPGLRWVRQLVLGPDGLPRSPGFALADWLRDLHPFLTKPTRPHYQALVDGLALIEHPQAAELQQLDE
ncbi:hypothetical protein [Streptomyces sp. NWU339]|uniref:hypothetical protein n=1 Tax=Streptomyces sp. NWU339 TaxID=2185284 RepID=UPI0011B4F931|nr:hypothetical protein [Streptomyces sp. NWU339]